MRRLAVGPDVGLELHEALVRFIERQHVLLRLDRADELIALDIELGAAHIVARMQQRHLVVGDLDRRLRVSLDDLLLGELQIEPRLFQVELLLRGVELDDDVAGLDGVARPGEVDNLQLAAHRRRRQLGRARGAEIADRVDGHLHAPAPDVCRRHRLRRRRRHAAQSGDTGEEQHNDGNRGVPYHRSTSSCSGCFSATRSPSLTPDAMAT